MLSCLCVPGAGLCGLQWNPNVDNVDLLIVSLSTGSLLLLSVKEDVRVVCANPNIHALSGKRIEGDVRCPLVKIFFSISVLESKGQTNSSGIEEWRDFATCDKSKF